MTMRQIASPFETGPPSAADALAAPGEPLRFRDRARLRAGRAEVLTFSLGGERFGVELRAVAEVVPSPELRPVPDAPPGLLGVFGLRERLVPLYSPGAVLGTAPRPDGVALVMRWGSRRVALAVDDADDVLSLDLGELRAAPPDGRDDDVVAGVVWRDGHLIAICDARALVNACAGALAVEER